MDEYKYHDGGECPVPAGTMIDVIHRDGERFYGHAALVKDGISFAAMFWDHDYEDPAGDIIAWRLSEVGK